MTEGKKSNANVWKVLAGVLVIFSFALGIWAYPQLPEQVPSHWNASGQVDGYTNALGGAFLLPAILLGVYILLWIIPKIDPKKENYQKMGKAYWVSAFFVTLVLSGVHIFAIAAALEITPSKQDLPIAWINIMIGLLFIILGNYMGKIKPNYTFGIRTPWTLANEEVWKKTHRFSGPVMLGAGVITIAAAFLPVSWNFGIMMVAVGGSAIIEIVYSYIVFKKIN